MCELMGMCFDQAVAGYMVISIPIIATAHERQRFLQCPWEGGRNGWP